MFLCAPPAAFSRSELPVNPAPLPLLALTMGDPCGVGAEVIARSLADPSLRQTCRPVVIGDAEILAQAARSCGVDLPVRSVVSIAAATSAVGVIEVWSPVPVQREALTVGHVCAEGGRLAVEWVMAAVDLALANEVDGIVTAPLNKEAMNRAGFAYAGHTELLGERTHTRDFRMMLASDRLRVIHATTHVALARVPELLTAERLDATVRLAWQALLDLEVETPRLAVAALNPHAGESGLFGQEDQEKVAPAVARAQQRGWNVTGPVPADTLFLRAWQGEFDGVVALYHDQGHIPVKLVAFADAVNVTLGLPIVRTSVDHGTAFDIAGRGVADATNMTCAIRLGTRLARSRTARNASGMMDGSTTPAL